MFTIVFSLFYSIRQGLRNRAVLQAEILALRHQLLVLQRSNGSHRPRLSFADRFLWVWLSQLWSGWRSALRIVKPETAPRIHGELLKLGFELSEATVAKYMVRHRKPSSQTWRTFLANHYLSS